MKRLLLILPLLCMAAMGVRDPAFLQKGIVVPSSGGGLFAVTNTFDTGFADGDNLNVSNAWINVSGTLSINKPSADGSVYANNISATSEYYNTNTFSANHRAEFTIDSLTVGAIYIGAFVRYQVSPKHYYSLAIDSTGTQLYLQVDFSTTIIQDLAMSLAVGNKLSIEASGTGAATRLAVQIDTGSGWVTKWSNQDPATYYDGGTMGLLSFGQSVNLRVDDVIFRNLP